LLRAILQFFDLLSVYHLYCTIKRTFCLSCKRSCKKPNIEPCFCGICLTYFQFFMSFSSALANASSCSLVRLAGPFGCLPARRSFLFSCLRASRPSIFCAVYSSPFWLSTLARRARHILASP